MADRLALTQAVKVRSREVSWLWQGWVAQGKICVLAGEPGVGKSYLTLYMASVVTSGREWPSGESCPQGPVILISAEDDPADTVQPRLANMGASLDLVWLEGVEEPSGFNMHHADALKEAIQEHAALMVVIDPVAAFWGHADSHKSQDIRGVLAPLAAVASQTGAAIVLVAHPNKGASINPLFRVNGSLDLVAAARLGHLVAKDPACDGRRLLLPMKSNIGRQPKGLGFRIEDDGLRFDALPVTIDASVALAEAMTAGHDQVERGVAEEFLLAELQDGPVPANDLIARGEGQHISARVLRRAADGLKVRKVKEGYSPSRWMWYLPEAVAPSTED
jgi:hypothetical protein